MRLFPVRLIFLSLCIENFGSRRSTLVRHFLFPETKINRRKKTERIATPETIIVFSFSYAPYDMQHIDDELKYDQ